VLSKRLLAADESFGLIKTIFAPGGLAPVRCTVWLAFRFTLLSVVQCRSMLCHRVAGRAYLYVASLLFAGAPTAFKKGLDGPELGGPSTPPALDTDSGCLCAARQDLEVRLLHGCGCD
jgi:hypothetical protein